MEYNFPFIGKNGNEKALLRFCFKPPSMAQAR
jgi:hypothetical protein